LRCFVVVPGGRARSQSALFGDLALAPGAVGYREAGILGDEVGVDGDPGLDARIGGPDDLRHEIGHVPRHPNPGHGGEAGRVGVDVLAEGMGDRLEVEAGEHLGTSHEARHERQGAQRDDLAAAQPDARSRRPSNTPTFSSPTAE
jgi:hypothetical protein